MSPNQRRRLSVCNFSLCVFLREPPKHNAERLLKLIDGVYRFLPLGTIVNNRVLVVHGGISDTTDLDMIRSLDRGKYVSLLRPPLTNTANPGSEVIDKVEWKQVSTNH